MSEHRRYIKNYIINKPFQTRLTYYFVAISIGLFGLFIFSLNYHLDEMRFVIANVADYPMAAQLRVEEQIGQLTNTTYAFFALALISSIIYGVVISHRIAGPMFAILAFIKNLKAGDYDSKRSLRPYDELTPIMDELHELAEQLKSKR